MILSIEKFTDLSDDVVAKLLFFCSLGCSLLFEYFNLLLVLFQILLNLWCDPLLILSEEVVAVFLGVLRLLDRKMERSVGVLVHGFSRFATWLRD